MQPVAANHGRAHGLPKTHKPFESLPKFRPIVDTTNTTHYGVGKFLSQLLQPLTQNDFNIQDSFDAVDRIRNVSDELFDQGYRWVSFDVESLFTNVPLNKAVQIVLSRVYEGNLIKTNLQKRTLKKTNQRLLPENSFLVQLHPLRTNRWSCHGLLPWASFSQQCDDRT